MATFLFCRELGGGLGHQCSAGPDRRSAAGWRSCRARCTTGSVDGRRGIRLARRPSGAAADSPAGEGRQVFAYLKGDYAPHEAVLLGLKTAPFRTLAYVPGLPRVSASYCRALRVRCRTRRGRGSCRPLRRADHQTERRSSRLRILPTGDFGSVSRNSTWCGTL